MAERVRKFIALTMLFLPSLGLASAVGFYGPLNTLGRVSSAHTVLSITANPAVGEKLVSEQHPYRWSYFHGPTLGLEIGDVDNFSAQVDALVEALDELDALNVLQDSGLLTGSVTPEQKAEEIVASFNDVVIALGRDGYSEFYVASHLFGLPLVMRSQTLGGVISFDARSEVIGGVSFIGVPLTLSSSGNNVDTDSALLVSSSFLTTFAASYSWDATRYFNNRFYSSSKHDRRNGRLLAGVTLNYYRMGISTQVLGVLNLEGDDSFIDVVEAQFNSNLERSTDYGLDLGLLWQRDWYQVGLVWRNVVEPKFEASEIGVNCAGKADTSAQLNCRLASGLAESGAYVGKSSFELENYFMLETAISNETNSLAFLASYDLSPHKIVTGNQFQWLSLAASYQSGFRWMPGLRAGYRINTSGTEIQYISMGVSLIAGIQVDLSYALDDVQMGADIKDDANDEGDSMPRAFLLSLGLERKF